MIISSMVWTFAVWSVLVLVGYIVTENARITSDTIREGALIVAFVGAVAYLVS